MDLSAQVANLEARAKAFIADDRWKSSRLWVMILAILLVVLLHHFGIDRWIIAGVIGLSAWFITWRTLDDMNRDRCNASIAVARVEKGFDDGAPAKVGTETAANPSMPTKPSPPAA